jgi:diguanylate cyclase (GGDEF)-like protein
MALHTPTFAAALLAAFALLALGLAFAQPELRKRPELRLWMTGSLFLLPGLAALASSAFLPEWLDIVFGNGFVLCSLWYFSRAIHRFVMDEEAPRWQRYLVPAGVLGLMAMTFFPTQLLRIVVTALFAAEILPSVILIVRHGWRAETSLRAVAVLLALAVALQLADPDRVGVIFFFLLLGAGIALLLSVTERLAGQMKLLATHDGLTGCVNRVYFDAILNHALERGRRDRAPVSLILMDLDRLKEINDRHGHGAGDDLLRSFAQCVRERSRKSDVFGRLGGEEFGLILPVTNVTGALLLAEKVRTATERLSTRAPGGERISVTVALGVSTAQPRDDLSGNQTYAEAEEGLSMAKQRGGNMVVHFATVVRPPA